MKKLGKNKKAVVLLSGGLDSSVVLAIASNKFQKIYCISFDYGQRHKRELEYAKKQVQKQNIKFHKIFKIDFFGGSSLTDKIDVPQNVSVELIPKNNPLIYNTKKDIANISVYAKNKDYHNVIEKKIIKLKNTFEKELANIPNWSLLGIGGYFAYLGYNSTLGSISMAKKLLTDQNILSIPGDMFFPKAKNLFIKEKRSIRIAFANSTNEEIIELFKRLKNFSL